MNPNRIRAFAVTVSIGLAAAVSHARAQQPGQTAAATCRSAETGQFDFWVGEWDLSWEGGAGTNRIEKIMGGCVIQENFDGTQAMKLQGMSVSTWNPKLGKWRQTWVDNQGGYLDFVGGFEGGRMTLTRPAPVLGDNVVQRMVWYNIENDSFNWNWERSDDGGKTWKVNWKIAYVRAGIAPAGDAGSGR